MANTGIPLHALGLTPYSSYVQGEMNGLSRDKLRAETAESQAKADDAQIARVRNIAYDIVNDPNPQSQAAKVARFNQVGPRMFPQFAGSGETTLDEMRQIIAMGTSPDDALKQQKTQAEIGYVDAGTGLRYEQTATIGRDDERADWKTSADVANDTRRTGYYGANVGSMIGDRDRRFARDGANTGGGLKAPSGYRYTEDGNLTFIPGGPADPVVKGPQGGSVEIGADGTLRVQPKRTEAQSKDLYYLNRAQTTADQLDQADQALTSYGESAAGMLGSAGNYLRSEKYQIADQLGDEWIASVLRKESGAAIPEGEMARYRQTYLPRPGDDAGTIQRKREARRTVIESMRLGLGSLSSEVPPGSGIVAPGGASDPYADVDAIVGLGR